MLSLVLACSSEPEHPSDAELEKNFYAHEADFNLLAQMAIEDADMISITPTSTERKKNSDGQASKAKDAFSLERYEQYRQIFNRLGKNDGITNYQPSEMRVSVSMHGTLTRITSKGYAYLPEKPTEMRESLDKVSFEDYRQYNVAYKHLKGNWYLYYSTT